MIEIMVTHGGSADLPMREVGDVLVPDADMDGLQAAAHRILIGQIRQGILAERLGYDAWYQTEHHFQPEAIEFNPNPLMAQMAVAAHTKRIRLGQAANIITWHHPLRFAEQIAILDVVSGGRVDCGVGRGYQPRELETIGLPFGASAGDQEKLRAAFEENLEIIIKAWTQKSFSHHGDIYSIPPKWLRWDNPVTDAYFSDSSVGRGRNQVFGPAGQLKELTVYPQPVQRPHPPLWQPMASPRSIAWAAQHGINGYYLTETNARLKAKLDFYHEAAATAGFPDYLDRGEFKFGWDGEKRRGQVPGRWIHIEQGGVGNIEKASRGMQQQWDFYRGFGFGPLLADDGETPLDKDERVPVSYLRDKGIVLYGTAEFVAQEILRTKQECGYDDFAINLFFEVNGLSSAEVEEQMTVFAEEVMPILRQECGGGPDFPNSTVDLGVAAAELTS